MKKDFEDPGGVFWDSRTEIPAVCSYLKNENSNNIAVK